MSKLVEKLEHIEAGSPQPLGFGARSAQGRPSSMLLLACVAAEDADKAKSLEPLGIDGVIIKTDDPASAEGPVDGLLWGAWLGEASSGGIDALKEKGCDFVVFQPENMPLAALDREDEGRMLVLGADLTHEQRRTVDSLPVDVVLIAPDGDGDSLTVKGLMDILTMAWGAGKPALLLWNGPLTTGELEGLRGADINGIVVDASKADKGVIEGLKGAIDSLPRKARRQRGGPRRATVPNAAGFITDVEDDYEEDDE